MVLVHWRHERAGDSGTRSEIFLYSHGANVLRHERSFCPRSRAQRKWMQPMIRLPLSLVFSLFLMNGCSQPDEVKIYKSPVEGLYYTVEGYHAAGPTSDTSRVVAHMVRNGEETTLLVLEGENLVVANVHWESPSEVTLCLDGGITSTFRNEVTLISGRESVTLRNLLTETCVSEGAKPEPESR
jgi:hypothetical protein